MVKQVFKVGILFRARVKFRAGVIVRLGPSFRVSALGCPTMNSRALFLSVVFKKVMSKLSGRSSHFEGRQSVNLSYDTPTSFVLAKPI